MNAHWFPVSTVGGQWVIYYKNAVLNSNEKEFIIYFTWNDKIMDSVMNYIELNTEQKLKMTGICQNAEEFDWEDQHILTVLAGELSKLRMHSQNKEVQDLMREIEKVYGAYSFFHTDQDAFISKLNLLVEKIRVIDPFWMGIYTSSIKEEMALRSSGMPALWV